MASILNLSPSIHELDSKCIRSLSILQVIRCANNLKDQKLAKYDIFFYKFWSSRGDREIRTSDLQFKMCGP